MLKGNTEQSVLRSLLWQSRPLWRPEEEDNKRAEELSATGPTDSIAHEERDLVSQEFAFKVHEPNSLTYDNVDGCPNTGVPDIEPVDDKLNFVFLLGAQKSGTTWLHNALVKHSLFVEANNTWGCDSLSLTLTD